MSEFKFTDAEWRKYQQMPDQGYSHRGHLEFVVNRWLAEHDKKVIAKAFHEWADFQIDSLRVAPTTDEDYEEAKRYADAAKYWADNIILKGETE